MPFDLEQLEEIYMMIDDASFQRISRRAKIDVFDDKPVAYEQPEQSHKAFAAGLLEELK